MNHNLVCQYVGSIVAIVMRMCAVRLCVRVTVSFFCGKGEGTDGFSVFPVLECVKSSVSGWCVAVEHGQWD